MVTLLTVDEIQARREWLWECYQTALEVYNAQTRGEVDLGEYAMTLEIGARLLDQVVQGRALKTWFDYAVHNFLCTHPERDRN